MGKVFDDFSSGKIRGGGGGLGVGTKSSHFTKSHFLSLNTLHTGHGIPHAVLRPLLPNHIPPPPPPTTLFLPKRGIQVTFCSARTNLREAEREARALV